MTCEIVDNIACGKPFRFCRTHKVEERDCPKNTPEKGLSNVVVKTLRDENLFLDLSWIKEMQEYINSGLDDTYQKYYFAD